MTPSPSSSQALMSNARRSASGESWSCQTFVMTDNSARLAPGVAIAPPWIDFVS